LYQQKRFADLPVPHKDKVGCEAHMLLTREAAARSFVLIKNQKNTNGHCVLPVTKNQSMALIGTLAKTPNLGDHGSSDGRPKYVVTPLEGLQQQLSEHQTLAYNDGTDIEAAVELARLNDVAILVVGYTAEDEGEYIAPISMGPFADGIKPPRVLNNLFKIKALKPLWRKIVDWASERNRKKRDINNNESFGRGGDRRSLKLPPHHESLIKAVSAVNPNTVVLIMAGSAVTMEDWRHDVSAIMNVWYPGMQGGNAIADVILGVLSPSGKLPFTMPEDAAHLPEFDIDVTSIEYDAWHGYQRFAKYGYKAAYPFGHGLNYADLTWQPSSINKSRFAEHDEIIMQVEIQNAADIDCFETAMCFLKSKQDDREYPLIELKGFSSKRVAANSNQLISVSVPIANIAYYSEEQSMMTYTPGSYEVALCKDAEDSSAVWHPIVLE
jgi:beta-glucosidase